MIAKVLWCGQLEQVGIESRHLGLNVIEKVGLNQVRAVHADRHLLEKFCNRQVLRADALLNEVDFVCVLVLLQLGVAEIKGLNSFLRKTEAVEGVQSIFLRTHILDDEN